MSKFASISVPGGRRVARVALVSVLLAAAGSALGADDDRNGPRGAGNASGVSRMMGSAAGGSRSGGGGGHAAPSGGSRMVSSGGGQRSAPAAVQQSRGGGMQVRSQPSAPSRQGSGMMGQPQAQPPRSQPQGSSMVSPQRYSGAPRTQSAPSAPSAPRSIATPGAPQGTPSAPMQNMPGLRGTTQTSAQPVARSSFARMAASGRRNGEVSRETTGQTSTPTLGASSTGTASGVQTVNAGRPRGETSMFRTFFPERTSSGSAPTSGRSTALPADSLAVGASGRWDGHGGNWHGGGGHGDGWHGDGWHGHDGHWSHDHHDHWHFSLGWYPYYYPYHSYPYYGCSTLWPYSGFSIGFSYGSGWCWPYYSSWYYPTTYYSGYYNPVSYAMSYPSYGAMDYGGYGNTVINNYYTGSDVGGGTGMSALPGAVYVDNGFKPNPPDDAATVYRSLANHGPMAWSDTATSIVNAMVAAPADQRPSVAKRYLGRMPVGAWEATYEGRQDIENATELTCRGTGTTTTGGRPTIIVRINRKVDALLPGQRLSVTGRLVEVSVDDSSNPGGVLVLEDADVSW